MNEFKEFLDFYLLSNNRKSESANLDQLRS